MAKPVEMVHTTGYTVPQDDQSWLINRITDGIREAQLDLSLFTGDKEKEQKYFAFRSPRSPAPACSARMTRPPTMAASSRSPVSLKASCTWCSRAPASRTSIRPLACATWPSSTATTCRSHWRKAPFSRALFSTTTRTLAAM